MINTILLSLLTAPVHGVDYYDTQQYTCEKILEESTAQVKFYLDACNDGKYRHWKVARSGGLVQLVPTNKIESVKTEIEDPKPIEDKVKHVRDLFKKAGKRPPTYWQIQFIHDKGWLNKNE